MTRCRELLWKFTGPTIGIAAVYLYLWFAMDMPQLHHDQPRAFMWGIDFLCEFLNYSGGPAAYVHAFLVQLYACKWAGIAVLTALFAAVYTSARIVLSLYTEQTPLFTPLIPAALGVVLVDSRMTIVPIMAMAVSLCSSYLYSRFPLRNRAIRLIFFLVSAAILYWALAGGFLLFVALCAMHEFITRRRWLAVAVLTMGSLVPMVMRHWLYEAELPGLYFRNAPLEEKTKTIDAVTVALYLVAWLSVPAGILSAAAGRSKWMNRLRKPGLIPLAGKIIMIATAAAALAIPPVQRARHRDWTVVERLVDEEHWEDALACVRLLPEHNVLVSHMANRALFHTGRLLDEMFKYPQYTGAEVLLLDGKDMDAMPRAFDKRSSVYLELGMMSRAERWTLEAITITGELPSLSKRMITINIAKGHPAVAAAYLGAVKKMPFHREWAIEMEQRLQNDPLLEQDAGILTLRKSMLKVNYVDTLTPEELLGLCLATNPDNRMAFEYLMAHYLLTRRPDKLVQYTELLNRFGATRIPRHLEEALISYSRSTGRALTLPDMLVVSHDTASRFERFLAVAGTHRSNDDTTRELLRKEFGDTYWFFETFSQSGSADEPAAKKRAFSLRRAGSDDPADGWHQGRE